MITRRSQACAVSSSYCRCHQSASTIGSASPGHSSTRRFIVAASLVASRSCISATRSVPATK
jgi:hypothetical protein